MRYKRKLGHGLAFHLKRIWNFSGNEKRISFMRARRNDLQI